MTRNLSIVVPVLNERANILPCLYDLAKASPIEIIVVDNGSTDDTAEIVDRWIRWDVLPAGELRIIRLPNPGKGAAVRAGMLAAKGENIYMADCDLSTPWESIIDFLLMMRASRADIVIGSRRMRNSKVTQSSRRAVSHALFHMLTRKLLPDIHDTQCGFKLFNRNAARNIFYNLQLDGLAFDVEMLLEAKRLGYTVIEMGVPWVEGLTSSVHIVRDGIRMARDLWSLARRYRFNKRAVELGTSLPL
jgi:dolichyl-phosphate beta-glucosyltransferase